jgi:heterodisulfide reductase subunit A-like polyferredoxin
VDEHSHAVIEPAQCHGCGTCAAECPGKAITLKRFNDEQLFIYRVNALVSFRKRELPGCAPIIRLD